MKIYKLLLISLILAIIIIPVSAEEGRQNMKIKFNGVLCETENIAFYDNNIVRLDLKELCNILGVELRWVKFQVKENEDDASNGCFVLSKDGVRLSLFIPSRRSISAYESDIVYSKHITSIEKPEITEDVFTQIVCRFGYLIKIDKTNFIIEIDELNPVNIYINNTKLPFDNNLVCYGNLPLLPMRAVFKLWAQLSIGMKKMVRL